VDTYAIDERLRLIYEQSAPVINEAAFRARLSGSTSRKRSKIFAAAYSRRRPVLIGLATVVVLAFCAVGLYEGLSDFGKERSVVVITDSPTGPTGQASMPQPAGLPVAMPSDFGFVASYGVGAANTLDTLNGTFIKEDTGSEDPPAKTDLRLTNAEIEELYRDLVDINPFSYGRPYDPEAQAGFTGSTVYHTPYQTYKLKVHLGGETWSVVVWNDQTLSTDPKADALRAWFNRLQQMIEATPEWQGLGQGPRLRWGEEAVLDGRTIKVEQPVEAPDETIKVEQPVHAPDETGAPSGFVLVYVAYSLVTITNTGSEPLTCAAGEFLLMGNSSGGSGGHSGPEKTLAGHEVLDLVTLQPGESVTAAVRFSLKQGDHPVKVLLGTRDSTGSVHLSTSEWLASWQ
jgi:hypothetical protein